MPRKQNRPSATWKTRSWASFGNTARPPRPGPNGVRGKSAHEGLDGADDLARLEEKGYLRHTTEGRTYLYVPTVASQNVAADAVRGIIERFCNGSVENLLVGMVDREVVSAATLQNLAKRIAANKGK